MRVKSTAPPQHLIKLMPTESEQYAYCKSIGCCFECEWCVGYSESWSKKPKHTKKEKIIKTDSNTTKWDNLAKNVVKVSEEFDHPLYHEIIRVFKKK